jgi:hypothetical protein
MKYTLILCNNRKLIYSLQAFVIRLVEGTPFNHASILCSSDTEQWVYEANWPFSRKVSYDEWLKTYAPYVMYELPVEESKQRLALSWLNIQVGKPYSLWQDVIIGFCQLFPPIGRILAATSNECLKVTTNCTEHCARFLNLIFDTQFCVPYDLIGLNELYDVIRKESFGSRGAVGFQEEKQESPQGT